MAGRAKRPRVAASGRAWLAVQTAAGRRAARPIVMLGLAGVAAGIGQAWCVAMLMARLLGDPVDAPALWAAGFACLSLARAWLGVAADAAGVSAGVSARRRLRSGVMAGLLAAGPAVLRNRQAGELAGAAVDRIEALDGLFARWLPAASLAVAGPALVLLAALLADPWAALILLGAGLLVPVGMALAGLGAAAASQRQFVAMDRLQSRFLDRMRGIATIVLAGRAEDEAVRLQADAADLSRRTLRVLRVAFLSSAVLDLAAAAALVLLAVHYATALQGGALQTVPAIFQLVLVAEFFAPLRVFAAVYQDRLQAGTAAADLAALPAAPAADGPPVATRTVEATGVTVAFENVSFTWDAARGPVLDGLSFRIPAGETVVLVGPSGAGKSTILELLLGFARPDAGRITINGADVASIVPAALARMTAWIGQHPVIFAGTIRDNIRFGREDASDADVQAAARAARISQFADALPLGLDTPVGEGGYGLSGGQAQRIAIARAFVRNAPLLLLDEPTAHLDPATESDVLDSLSRLALGRTVILASHSAAAHAFGGRRLLLSEGQARAVRGAA
ncbi:MAG TPA: thiol reductant ABC exporter subunit CydD [Acetobacteraceae bacterium]